MVLHYFALIMGALFIMAGVGGFLPYITTDIEHHAPDLAIEASYGRLLGLFPINLVHNLIHLTLGIWGVAAYRNMAQSRSYCQFLAVLLSVFTVLGFVAPSGLGILPLFSHDIWLHGLEAIAAAYLGFFYMPNPEVVASQI